MPSAAILSLPSPSPSPPSSPRPPLSPVLSHKSWFNNKYATIPEDAEHVTNYAPGGFHPVTLGELFHHDRYQILHKLGASGEATVWLVLDRQQSKSKYAALKILTARSSSRSSSSSSSSSDRTMDLQVYQYLDLDASTSTSSSRFICPLRDHFYLQGPRGRHLCLVMPFSGPNIIQSISTMSQHGTSQQHWDLIRRLLRQVIQAVAFLHSKGIVHGDLTPSNIVTKLKCLDSWSLDDLYDKISQPIKIKPKERGEGYTPEYLVEPAELWNLPSGIILDEIEVLDFGQAFLMETTPESGVGIPTKYAAPELILQKKASVHSDIWALGCTLFEICSGESLFHGREDGYVLSEMVRMFGRLPTSLWHIWDGRNNFFTEDGRDLMQFPAPRQSLRETIELVLSDTISPPNRYPELLLSTSGSEKIGALHSIPNKRPISILKLACSQNHAPGLNHPFSGNSTTQVATYVQHLVFSRENNFGLIDLLSQTMEYIPEQRTPAIILSYHPWLVSEPDTSARYDFYSCRLNINTIANICKSDKWECCGDNSTIGNSTSHGKENSEASLDSLNLAQALYFYSITTNIPLIILVKLVFNPLT